MKNKIILKRATSIVLSVLLLALVFAPAITYAQLDFGEDYGGEVGLSGDRDIRDIIASIIRILLGFLGIVALIIILIGGVEWMTAGGNDDKVKTAQKRIGYGVIGLIIIFVAYALTLFIFDVIFKATTGEL